MNTNTPAPGWFPDPGNSNQLRWWDGDAWTDQTRPSSLAPAEQANVQAAGWNSSAAQATITPAGPKKPWYARWWAITAAVLVALTVLGSLLPDENAPAPATAASDTQDAAVEPVEASSSASDEPEAAPEPVDTDGDGVNDDEDFLPDDPKVQTQDDVDTDKDGVPDYTDAFPDDAKYSKDTDGDRVADQLDAFPKDERYSKDSDGDHVADSEDDFPADPSRSKITAAMENALDAAESYLDYTAFSRTGLIDQLEYEGYETADATFAVDYLKVNWNEQAFKSAQSYLDYTSFSLEGLIEQLQYEGFTYEQAAYGANKAY
jgi:hypothetical protein